MATIKSIAKNIGAFTLAKLITMVLSFIFLIVLARSLGDVDFGKFSFAQSFTESLVVITADIGLSTLAIREIARRKDLTPVFLGNIFVIKIILGIATYGLIILIMNFLNYPQDTTTAVFILGGSAIITSFSAFFRSIYRAFERLEFEAILNIVRSIIITSVGLYLLFAGYGLVEIAYAYLIGTAIDFVLSLVLVTSKFSKPDFRLDFSFWKRNILLSIPFSVTIIFGIIYLQIDIVMLSILSGDASVGWYRAAFLLVYSLVFIPEVFGYAIFPVMSRLFVSSKHLLIILLERSMKYLFIIGLPITILIFYLSDWIVPFLFGEEYGPSIMILQILCLYLPLRFMNHATGYTLSSIDRQSRRAISAVAAGIFNICLNLVLIPRFDANGAAIATVVTEVLLFTMYYLFVASYFHKVRLSSVVLKPLVASLPMILFIYIFAAQPIFLIAPLSILIYLVVLFLTRAIDEEDKRIIREIVHRQGG